jgi:hypothetical protein
MRVGIIIIALILLISCSFKNEINKIILENERFAIDSNIASRKLEIKETIYIEEKEQLILHNISGVDINPLTNELIICDPSNRSLNMYDLSTGKIKKFYKAGLSLSDSVAVSKRKMLKTSWNGYKSFKYIKIDEYKDYELSENNLALINNMLFVPRFIDNNLEVLSVIYCQAVAEDLTDKEKRISNNASIISFDDELNIKNVSILEITEKSYPVPYSFAKDKLKNSYLVSTSDYPRHSIDKKYDTLPAISEYNARGDYLETNFFLSKIYEESLVGYGVPNMVNITEIYNKFFITLTADLNVYDKYNKKRFGIKNLPFTNDSGFALYCQYFSQLNSPKISYEIKKSNLLRLFPVHIINTFEISGNFVVQILVYDDLSEQGYYYIVQEYTPDGALLSQTNLYDDNEFKIKYLAYNREKNELIIFKKGKKRWVMEKRDW